MTLILLLIVLVTERVALQSARWRVESYLRPYVTFSSKSFPIKPDEPVSLLIFVAAPALVFGLFLWFFGSLLIEFVVGFAVLAVAIGNSKIRTHYRQFLNAAQRDDVEAMQILREKMDSQAMLMQKLDAATAEDDEPLDGEPTEQSEPTANTANPLPLAGLDDVLIWQNFKFYAAPIFYFVIFGVPGVVCYATLLYLVEDEYCLKRLLAEDKREKVYRQLDQWLEYLYFVPARFVTLGYMFVGHFSNGLEAWLKNAVNVKVDSRKMLVAVARAADGNNEDPHGRHMVKLAKRNMVLFIVVVALMTLYGQIV